MPIKNRGDNMLPNDPMILLSYVNTKLRDYYSTLNLLCDDLNVNREELEQKLSAVDYRYDSKLNRFI